ncbi:hypothetical protein ACN47E_007769 [Coniothyrium glycines]
MAIGKKVANRSTVAAVDSVDTAQVARQRAVASSIILSPSTSGASSPASSSCLLSPVSCYREDPNCIGSKRKRADSCSSPEDSTTNPSHKRRSSMANFPNLPAPLQSDPGRLQQNNDKYKKKHTQRIPDRKKLQETHGRSGKIPQFATRTSAVEKDSQIFAFQCNNGLAQGEVKKPVDAGRKSIESDTPRLSKNTSNHTSAITTKYGQPIKKNDSTLTKKLTASHTETTKSTEAKRSSMETTIAPLQENMSGLRSSIQSFQDQIQYLQAHLSDDVPQILEKIMESRKRLDALEKHVSSSEPPAESEVVSDLNSKVHDLVKRFDKWQPSWSAQAEGLRKHGRDIRDIKTQLRDLLKKVDAQIRERQTETSQQATEKQRLGKRLDEAEHYNKTLAAELKDLKNAVENGMHKSIPTEPSHASLERLWKQIESDLHKRLDNSQSRTNHIHDTLIGRLDELRTAHANQDQALQDLRGHVKATAAATEAATKIFNDNRVTFEDALAEAQANTTCNFKKVGEMQFSLEAQVNELKTANDSTTKEAEATSAVAQDLDKRIIDLADKSVSILQIAKDCRSNTADLSAKLDQCQSQVDSIQHANQTQSKRWHSSSAANNTNQQLPMTVSGKVESMTEATRKTTEVWIAQVHKLKGKIEELSAEHDALRMKHDIVAVNVRHFLELFEKRQPQFQQIVQGQQDNASRIDQHVTSCMEKFASLDLSMQNVVTTSSTFATQETLKAEILALDTRTNNNVGRLNHTCQERAKQSQLRTTEIMRGHQQLADHVTSVLKSTWNVPASTSEHRLPQIFGPQRGNQVIAQQGSPNAAVAQSRKLPEQYLGQRPKMLHATHGPALQQSRIAAAVESPVQESIPETMPQQGKPRRRDIVDLTEQEE